MEVLDAEGGIAGVTDSWWGMSMKTGGLPQILIDNPPLIRQDKYFRRSK